MTFMFRVQISKSVCCNLKIAWIDEEMASRSLGNSKNTRCSTFNSDVLKLRDCNNDLISDWCIPGFKPEEGICIVCDMTIKCNQHGVTAIKRHAGIKKHLDNCNKVRDEDGRIKPKKIQRRLDFAHNNCQQLGERDKLTVAETLFTLAVAKCNIPFVFSDTATELFHKMFPDSKLASEFSVSRTKISYIVSDGLGPFFKESLVNEINKYGSYYSIQVDETPIQEKRTQQLDVLIRFYSESKQKVLNKHLESFHLGHATSDILFDCVKKALSQLSSQKLISFYSDGPNVMKALKKKMLTLNDNLIDISECLLHKVHNAFSEGLNSFGGDIESLIIDIYQFFKNSAAQSSDFRDLQMKLDLPENVFIRHVSSRWLTIEASVGRFIEQYAALKKFFGSSAPGRQSARYYRIQSSLNDKSTLARALFLQNVCPLLTKFLTVFQSNMPLIPILYDEMVNMVKGIMGRFLETKIYSSKTGMELKKVDVTKGELWKKPEIGLDTEKESKGLDERAKKEFMLGARSFYISTVKYLLNTLPLDNKFLERLKCIHPQFVKEDSSLACIKAIAREVPNIISTSSVSSLADEWIVLQSEDISTNDESSTEGSNIQRYWNFIFSLKKTDGSVKFQYIQILVKALLALPHGNAECERGFSINNALLSRRSSLSLTTINGLRNVKSYLEDYDSVADVTLSNDLLRSVKNSFKKYNQRLETEKKEKEFDDQQKESVNKEHKLKEKEKELNFRLKASQKMLQNAQNLIRDGLKRKHFSDIESGQVLLDESSSKIKSILEDLERNRQEQGLLSKKRKI